MVNVDNAGVLLVAIFWRFSRSTWRQEIQIASPDLSAIMDVVGAGVLLLAGL